MSIEELVNRAYTTWAYETGTSWTDHMRAALTEQAAAYEQRIRELEAQRVPEGWIQVSERLPEQDVSFLAVTDCAGDIHISTMRLPVLISKNSKPDGDFIRERVTHWMPLPAAPASTAPRTIRIGELEAQRVPDGYVMVPVEPTDQMIDHGCDAANAFRVDICRAWDAMLMASPEVGSHD